MRLALAAALLVSCLAGCEDGGRSRSFTGPRAVPILTPVVVPSPTVVYTGTLSASHACADQLPAGDAVRVYVVTLSADGRLTWSAPTIPQSPDPQGSWLKVDGDLVSLMVGSGWQSQGEVFHGIWEDRGGGHELAISGRGSGLVEGAGMSGTFEGDFYTWDENSSVPGISCHAADHRFTLTPR
jgi:hypothetical protein